VPVVRRTLPRPAVELVLRRAAPPVRVVPVRVPEEVVRPVVLEAVVFCEPLVLVPPRDAVVFRAPVVRPPVAREAVRRAVVAARLAVFRAPVVAFRAVLRTAFAVREAVRATVRVALRAVVLVFRAVLRAAPVVRFAVLRVEREAVLRDRAVVPVRDREDVPRVRLLLVLPDLLPVARERVVPVPREPVVRERVLPPARLRVPVLRDGLFVRRPRVARAGLPSMISFRRLVIRSPSRSSFSVPISAARGKIMDSSSSTCSVIAWARAINLPRIVCSLPFRDMRSLMIVSAAACSSSASSMSSAIPAERIAG
jgi:hypothetical protein